MINKVHYSLIVIILSLLVSGCSSTPTKMNDLSGKVLFMGVRVTPGTKVRRKPFNAYASDLFLRASSRTLLIWGANLKSLQNQESLPLTCETVACEAEEASSLNIGHFFDVHLQHGSNGKTVVSAAIWKVRPLTLERIVTRQFLPSENDAFGVLPSAINQLLSTQGMYFSPTDMQPESTPARAIFHLISRGQLEQAVGIGRASFANAQMDHDPELYEAYFQALLVSSLTSKAISIGHRALEHHKITPGLVLGLRQLELDLGQPGQARGVLYKGLSQLPDSRSLWSYVVEDQVWRGHSEEALRLSKVFRSRHPGVRLPSRMTGAVFAAYVFSNQGERADRWNLTRKVSEPPINKMRLVRHAILVRLTQQGNLSAVVEKARGWILEGSSQKELYQDLMIAEGGLNEPIDEARTARHAIAAGASNSWILKRLSDLSARGY